MSLAVRLAHFLLLRTVVLPLALLRMRGADRDERSVAPTVDVEATRSSSSCSSAESTHGECIAVTGAETLPLGTRGDADKKPSDRHKMGALAPSRPCMALLAEPESLDRMEAASVMLPVRVGVMLTSLLHFGLSEASRSGEVQQLLSHPPALVPLLLLDDAQDPSSGALDSSVLPSNLVGDVVADSRHFLGSLAEDESGGD